MNQLTDTNAPVQPLVERMYWTVPTHYSQGDEHPSFEAAVQAARSTITCFTYAGQGPDGADLVRYSRAFVDLRQVTRNPSGAHDDVALRFEVTLQAVRPVGLGS